jgi:hypothetical protein
MDAKDIESLDKHMQGRFPRCSATHLSENGIIFIYCDKYKAISWRACWKMGESRRILPPMKKPRVIIKTVTSHQVYVEQDGEMVLYAFTPKLERAKRLVQKAKREFGIGPAAKTKK